MPAQEEGNTGERLHRGGRGISLRAALCTQFVEEVVLNLAFTASTFGKQSDGETLYSEY